MNLATMLCQLRALVDQGLGVADEKDSAAPQKEHLFFHDVLVEFNSFLTSIIEVFVVKEVTKRKIELQTKINAPKLLNEVRRNAKVGLSLLDLVLSFVTLKESLGMQRATLSGLMANGGIAEANDESMHTEVVEATSRLNLIVNDLVLVVENQDWIMRDLRKLLGLDIRHSSVASDDTGVEIKADELLFDENYRTLLRLVGESIRQSDGLGSLQEQIMNDFDIKAFQQAMKMEDFWAGITLYMDQLHSMELFLLEELENCEGGFEDLDLMSLGSGVQSSQSALNLERLSLSFGGVSEHNTVETVSKMTQEELKDTLLSLLAQTFTHKECQPSQLPVSPDKSKAGKAQLPSPARIKDHQKPALEEWEINLYEVEFHKRLGKGSAGTTYLCKYANQDVAVKVGAHTEMGLQGWTAELTSLKKMRHTNIIRFLGAIYNKSPLTYCLVLEYCDGGDLSVALSGNTPPKFFSNVTSGIASGLCYLHQKKYMHRDIKPSNVLLSGNLTSGQYTAKLTDFGLAVKVQTTSVTSGKKDLTAETGTYRYMAPEVIRHELYDYAADVYSFGLLMWAIITHETPFENKGPIEAAGSVALEGKRPPFPNDTPLTVKTLIENCWAEKPSERSNVVRVIKSLDELGRNVATESWLSAPAGHPVYKQALPETPQQGIADSSPKVKPKKVSVLKGGLLFRRKK